MLDDQISVPVVCFVTSGHGSVTPTCTKSPGHCARALYWLLTYTCIVWHRAICGSCAGGMWHYAVWCVGTGNLNFWKSKSFCAVTFCVSFTVFLCKGSTSSFQRGSTSIVTASLALLNSLSDMKLHCPCDLLCHFTAFFGDAGFRIVKTTAGSSETIVVTRTVHSAVFCRLWRCVEVGTKVVDE
jgi:hypothetical protein